MNTETNGVPEPQETPAPAAIPESRLLFWSVQRELWENRSIYIAPLTTAAFFLFGFVVSTFGMPHRRRATMLRDEAFQRSAVAQPYDALAIGLIIIAFIIGVFYCLDALYGERRDRSILFWKSMPVSDRTTIISKASIPLVILPLFTYALIVTMQFIMLLWTSLILMPSGQAWTTWARYNVIQQSVILLYGLIAIALWHAPIYGWLLVVSAWARRAAFLWAFLPLIVISMLEKMIFGTQYFGLMLKDRMGGFAPAAFAFNPHNKRPVIDSLSQLTPGNFLITPGLWIGLAFAAIFLVIAVRLRRDREPI
jgi:ABC-2 type transport system permease protein